MWFLIWFPEERLAVACFALLTDKMYAYMYSGFWRSIKNAGGAVYANEQYLSHFVMEGRELSKSTELGEYTILDGVLIHPSVRIDRGSVVRSFASFAHSDELTQFSDWSERVCGTKYGDCERRANQQCHRPGRRCYSSACIHLLFDCQVSIFPHFFSPYISFYSRSCQPWLHNWRMVKTWGYSWGDPGCLWGRWHSISTHGHHNFGYGLICLFFFVSQDANKVYRKRRRYGSRNYCQRLYRSSSQVHLEVCP